MASEQRIILIGAMGAGKTTLGLILARELGWSYIDNDHEMARLSGMSESELSTLSVPELHDLEESYLMDILSRPAPYIAGAAASVIDKDECIALLQSVTAIYLYLPVSELLHRSKIGKSGVGRQALNSNDAEQVISERFARRDPRYRQAASIVLDLSNDPESDAKRILALLR
jgi:shikimate kinase